MGKKGFYSKLSSIYDFKRKIFFLVDNQNFFWFSLCIGRKFKYQNSYLFLNVDPVFCEQLSRG